MTCFCTLRSIHIMQHCTLHFFTQVEGRKLPTGTNLFSQFPQTLLCVSDVESVVVFVDKCELCRGQNEEKFIAYIQTKEGKLKDHSGKFVFNIHHQIL